VSAATTSCRRGANHGETTPTEQRQDEAARITDVAKSRITYLLERVHAVRNLLGEPKPEEERWTSEDVADVTLEIASFLREALDVPALERELVASSQIDAKSLIEVTEWFESVGQQTPPPFGMRFHDGEDFDWQRCMKRLRDLLGGLTQAERLEAVEVGLRLGMVGDPAIASMLMALDADHELRERVRAKMLEKLGLLPDDDAFAFWARMRGEVDPSHECHIPIDPAIVPNAFFDLGTVATARDKIATYLTKVRPLLVRKVREHGPAAIPAGGAGVVSILAWKASPTTRTWSPTDRMMVRTLCRLACCWGRTGSDLADALGVQVGGYFVGRRGEQEAKRALDGHRGSRTPSPVRILTELEKLLRVAEQRAPHESGSVERALRAYKLGLEAMAQDIRREFTSKKELRLQREMCRFLVERDVRAYGTRFGQSEVDLRADDPLGAVVIEAKVLKSALSEKDMNRWLTQLGSYLDQEHLAFRGVLVLYNFSPTPIFCPAETIRFRFLLLAINICSESPSRRTWNVEVEATTEGPAIVHVHRTGEPIGVRSPARPSKKKSVASTKPAAPRTRPRKRS